MAVSADIPADKDALNVIAQASLDIKRVLDEKIADIPHTYAYTARKDYCSEECPIGEYITHLLHQEFPDIDAVAINAGAIRSALFKGAIYYNNLLDLYPYDSPAVLIKMSGKKLQQYIRHGIIHYHKRGKTNELLQTSGISYTFTADDKQISELTVGGKAVNPEQQYTILVPLFLANGGDRYPVMPYEETGMTVREILLHQLKNADNLLYQVQGNVRLLSKP